MGLLSKLSQVPAWAPLALKVHVPLHFDTHVKASAPVSRGVELFETESYISGYKMNQLDQFKSSIISGIFEYISTINPDSPNLLDRLRIVYQLSSILRDRSSLLYDFAESLPAHLPHFPLYWKTADATSCVPLRQLISSEFFLLRNSYDKIFDLDKQVLSKITFDEFSWLNSIVKDRGISIGKDFHLVPVIDGFAHSFDENTEVIKEGDVVRVFSKKDLSEGEVLTRNYGNKDNYQFLLSHGFLVENNPFHKVSFPPENLPGWLEISQKLGLTSKSELTRFENTENFSMSSLKRKLLQKFTPGLTDCAFTTHVPDPELEKIFKIVFLNETDMSDLRIKSYSDLFSHDFSSLISPRNQKNTEIFLFKSSEMMLEYLTLGFEGQHPLGKQIEELDKALVRRHFEYYKFRVLP